MVRLVSVGWIGLERVVGTDWSETGSVVGLGRTGKVMTRAVGLGRNSTGRGEASRVVLGWSVSVWMVGRERTGKAGRGWSEVWGGLGWIRQG